MDNLSSIDEWNIRKTLLDKLLWILSDGKSRNASELAELLSDDTTIPEHLINNVLLTEGRRYVIHTYNRPTHTYSLVNSEIESGKVAKSPSPLSTPQFSNGRQLRARYIGPDMQYICRLGDSTGPAFFEVMPLSSQIVLKLNENHPLTRQLELVLKADSETIPDDELRDRFADAQDMLDTLLIAWALYEQGEPQGHRRNKVQEARIDWGRAARTLMQEEDE